MRWEGNQDSCKEGGSNRVPELGSSRQQTFIVLEFWRLEVQSQGVNGAELSLTALGANSSLPCSRFQCRLTILDFSCLEMLHYSLCVCTSSFCAYLCVHMSPLYACQLYWMRVHTRTSFSLNYFYRDLVFKESHIKSILPLIFSVI